MAFSPTCSVVVCTRDRPDQLNRCLDSVARLEYPHFDVLVVDNSPGNGETRSVVQRRGIRYVEEPVPGISRVRNAGGRASGGDIVAYLDDDFLPERDWLARMAAEFEDPQVMAVAGRILGFGEDKEMSLLCERQGHFPLGGERRRAVDSHDPDWFECANFGGVVPGGNMAFRRKAFDGWKGFDERLGRGAAIGAGEENYAFFSLIDRGYRVVYTPLAVVRHPFPQTLEELRNKNLQALSAATAYTTFLFAEQPRYRRDILKYGFESLFGKRRAWKEDQGKAAAPNIPSWRAWLARLAGPWRYIRSRRSS